MDAQAAMAFVSIELDRAVARESLAKINLDKATRALAKKPKSAKAKKALEKARRELAVATRHKEKADANLKEETAERAVAAKKEAPPKKADATGTAKIYTEYDAFLRDSDSAEKLDPYYFFNDPVDYKGKAIVVDAKFDRATAPDQARFTIWRNFGKMPLIVSGFSGNNTLPQSQSVLLYGVITDFKNEVVSNELVLHTMVRLKGVFACPDNLCPKEGLQKVN